MEIATILFYIERNRHRAVRSHPSILTYWSIVGGKKGYQFCLWTEVLLNYEHWVLSEILYLLIQHMIPKMYLLSPIKFTLWKYHQPKCITWLRIYQFYLHTLQKLRGCSCSLWGVPLKWWSWFLFVVNENPSFHFIGIPIGQKHEIIIHMLKVSIEKETRPFKFSAEWLPMMLITANKQKGTSLVQPKP